MKIYLTNCFTKLIVNPKTLMSFVIVLTTLSSSTTYAKKTYFDLDEETKKVKSFKYIEEKGEVSYGSRIYKNNCQSCHGPIGVSYLSRLETPKILGLSGQQIVDRLVYYRDAESFSILLTGTALLMSRQALFLNDEQINAIARYFEEINPISDLNLAKEEELRKSLKKRAQVQLLGEDIGIIDKSFSQPSKNP